MNEESQKSFRDLIATRLAELDAEDQMGEAGQATVELDQQAVGRLSRMDAMQMQAMASAQSRRRAAQMGRVRAALARLDAGDYGLCVICEEEIEPSSVTGRPDLQVVDLRESTSPGAEA